MSQIYTWPPNSSTAPVGGATAANQVLEIAQLTGIHSDTTSLDGKTVHVDTGAVVVASSALPSGAATSANQTSEITQLTAIAGSTSSLDGKTVHVDTGNVTVSSSALPSGAATSSNQTNGTQVTSVNNFPATQPVSGTVTVVQPTGTNLHTVVDSSALPTGASTSALQNTINTTLGSPFQAGGSIGNTSFDVTQATAANLNATVVGTVTANAGTGTFAVSAAALPLPSGASTSALQTSGNASLASIDSNIASRLTGSLVPTAYDEIDLTYTGSDITLVEYKLATVLVRTLTLTYTGSNLTSVVAS